MAQAASPPDLCGQMELRPGWPVLRLNDPESLTMAWPVVLSGLGGATMLALGLDFVMPLGAAVSAVCDLMGVALVVYFVGLLDGQ
jgi:hypothetical protein